MLFLSGCALSNILHFLFLLYIKIDCKYQRAQIKDVVVVVVGVEDLIGDYPDSNPRLELLN